MAEIQGAEAGSWAGRSVLAVPFGEGEPPGILVGGPGAAGLDGLAVGATWVLVGPVEGERPLSGADASFTAYGGDLGAGAGIGTSIAAMDVNDDRHLDLVIAAPDAELDGLPGAGMATVVYGPLTMAPGQDLFLESAVIRGGAEGLGLGVGAQLVDDLTGTGDHNLLLGSRTGNAVYLYNQPPISPGGTHTATATIISGQDEDVGFGPWFDGRSDLDGDGQVDLVVAAPGSDQVYILAGPLVDLVDVADATVTISGDEVGQGLGDGLVSTVGDLDGDGHADLLLGDTDAGEGTGAGAAYVFLGPVGGGLEAGDADTKVFGAEAEMALGSSGVIGGDLDLDGLPDLVLGAPGAGGGVVLVFVGRGLGTYGSTDADTRLAGALPGQRVGASVAMPVDMNEDGLDDIITGGWSADDEAGAVWVFNGAAW
jgi:hypothetical protein